MINLNNEEVIINTAMVQLAKGIIQTVGKLHLTNQRLVLIPNQVLSLFCGKKLDINLSDIEEIQRLSRFEGGTWSGGAGEKLFVKLNNSEMHTFSYGLSQNAFEFFKSVEDQIEKIKS